MTETIALESRQLLTEAIVIEREPSSIWVTVEFESELGAIVARARLSRSAGAAHSGDIVLISGNCDDGLFVIDLLATPSCLDDDDSTHVSIEASDGATVTPVRQGTYRHLQIRSSEGQLLVEYNSETHQTTIHSRADTLVAVEGGDLDLAAQGDVRIAGQSINLIASDKVLMTSGKAGSADLTRLSLSSESTQLRTKFFRVAADHTDAELKCVQFRSEKAAASIDDIRLSSSVLTVAAKTVSQQADNVYQSVKGLVQCFTGRMRTKVDSTIHVSAEQAFLHADEDFNVQGDRINLG